MKVVAYICFGGITVLAALAAVAGMLSGYIHPEGKEWVSFPGVVLLPVLAVNWVLLLGWCVMRSRWLCVPLMALLLNAGFIFSMFQIRFGKHSEGPADRRVKMITYNVNNFHTDGPRTFPAFVGWIGEEQPDIVCLQECPHAASIPMDSIARSLPFLPYYCSTRLAGGGSTLAIFSRFPILWSDTVLYPGSSNKTLLASLLVHGDTVRLINNHLQTTSVNVVKPRLYQAKADGNAQEGTEAAFQMAFQMKRNFVLRAEQADFVRQLIGEHERLLLVCGDFNDTPASYAYRRVKGGLTDGFRDCGSGFGYTFRELRRLFRIDYIFYSSDFSGVRYESPDLQLSDHKPVVWTGWLR